MKLRLLSDSLKILLGIIGLGLTSFSHADLFDWGTPIAPAPGWQYRVYAEALPRIDNIDLDRHGNLYGTLERSRGRGKLIRIGMPASHKIILEGLNRPDGLVIIDDKLYLTEEIMQGRVIELDLKTDQSRTLARLDMPEGIEPLPKGGLVLSQDMGRGGLVHLDFNGKLTPLYSGLVRPEGLAVDRLGSIYIAETGTGRVLRLFNGKLSVMVADLNQPDQLLLQPDGSLWISEDAKDGRLLRLKDGKLDVIMEHLKSPQGMVFTDDGILLLAEQGRDRILAIKRSVSTKNGTISQ